MSLAGGQIILIDFNFNLQNSLKIFDKNSADKIWFEKDKECPPSCQLGLTTQAGIWTQRFQRFFT